MRRFNLFSGSLGVDADDPPGYGAAYAKVSHALGAVRHNLNVALLEPGQSLCPYHYEFAEEWLIVLEGRASVRHAEGEDVLERGDTVCFPAGPAGAHKIFNRGDVATRVIMFSVSDEPSVAVYPDSNKIGVWPGNAADSIIVSRDSAVEYWDGERVD